MLHVTVFDNYLRKLVSLIFFTLLISTQALSQDDIPMTAELELWLKADINKPHDDADVADADIVTTSGIVTTWRDRSGNGRDAINNNPTEGIKISTDAINGYFPVLFDASINHSGLEFGDFSISTDYQIYVVFKAGKPDARFFLAGESVRSLYGYHLGGLYVRGENSSGTDNVGWPTELGLNWGLLNIQRNSNTPTMSTDYLVNGGTFIGNLSGNSTNNAHTFGKVGNLNSDNLDFDGEIAEVIIYSECDAITRLRVNEYLTEKYGLSHAEDSETDELNSNFSSANKYLRVYGQDNGGKFGTNDSRSQLSSLEILKDEYTPTADGDYLLIGETDGSGLTFINAPNDLRIWDKKFYIEESGSNSVRLKFNIQDYELKDNDFGGDRVEGDYSLVYSSDNSSDYTIVAGVTPVFEGSDYIYFDLDDSDFSGNGYYTLASTAPEAYYARISDDWDKVYGDGTTIWTKDPSGAADGTTTIPTSEDQVIILNDRIVTITSGNFVSKSLEIADNGELHIGTTTGHDFGEISGKGVLVMEGDNFPSAATSQGSNGFLSSNGGTVKITGTGTSLSLDLPYNNLEIDLSSNTDEVQLESDLTIMNDLLVTKGSFVIGKSDGSNTAVTLTISNDLNVQSNGDISVGTDLVTQNVIIKGDLDNKGAIAFTNNSSANTFLSSDYLADLDAFYTTNPTEGYAVVTFDTPDKDQYVKCEGPTKFHQVVINKGTSDAYTLHFDATKQEYCEFLGKNNQTNSSSSTGGSMDTSNGMFVLQYGGLRFGSNIFVYKYATNTGNYDLSEETKLWIDDNAQVYFGSVNALVVYGNVLVSGGKLAIGPSYDGSNTGKSNSITLRTSGYVVQSGGEIHINQFKTSVGGSQHQGSLSIYGGDMIINGYPGTGAAALSLPYETNGFNMTDGTLTIRNEQSAVDLLMLGMSDGYYNVSGGEIILELNTDQNTSFVSAIPLKDLIIKSDYPARTLSLASKTVTIGGNDITIDSDLILTGNLTVNTNANFAIGAHNLTIGGFLDLYEDSDLSVGSNYTLTFNGESGHIDNRDPDKIFTIDNLYIDLLSDGGVFLLKSSATGAADEETRLIVNNNLTVTKGTFDYMEFGVELKGDLENGGVIGASSSVGLLKMNGTTSQSINGYYDLVSDQIDDLTKGSIQHLYLNNTSGIDLNNILYANKLTWEEGKIRANEYGVIIGDGYLNSIGSDFNTNDKYIIGSGASSDGGLTYLIYEDKPNYLFPLATLNNAEDTEKYSPVVANVTDLDVTGYLQVSAENKKLESFSSSSGDGTEGELLDFFWKTTVHEFDDNRPKVAYTFMYNEEDVGSEEINYILGRVKYEGDVLPREAIGTVDGSTNTATTSAVETDLMTAFYSIGEADRFADEVKIYYSYQGKNAGGTTARDAKWTDSYRWTTNPDWKTNGPTADGHSNSETPGAGDIVVIGYGSFNGTNFFGTEGHRVVIDNDLDIAAIRFESHPSANYAKADLARIRLSSGSLSADLIEDIGSIRYHKGATWNTVGTDMNDFLSESRSEVMLQSNGTDWEILDLPKYPAVRLWGNSSGEFTFSSSASEPIQIKSLMVDGTTLSLDKSIDVQDSINVGGFKEGTLLFNSPSSITVSCSNLNLENTISSKFTARNKILVDGVSNTMDHLLIVEQNITIPALNSNETGASSIKFDLYNEDANSGVVLELEGEYDGEFNNEVGITPELYKIKVNKGSSKDATFTFNSNFKLLGDATVSELIDFENGTLIFNNSSIDISVVDGIDWTIPSTAGLTLEEGTINILGSNSEVSLGGKLLVKGGTLNVNSDQNSIVYSTGGEFYQEGGTINIGAELRRSLFSEDASFIFSQTGGILNVGMNGAPTADRGVFEVIGSSSEFIHTGGEINVYRGKINIDVDNSTATKDGVFNLGNSSVTNQNVELVINNNIGSINLEESSLVTTTVSTFDLNILGDVTVGAGTTLNFNSKNLSILGELTNNGTIAATTSSFSFDGSDPQSINGTSVVTVNNLTINSAGNIVTLNNDFNVENEFNLKSGTLNDGGFVLAVKGGVNIEGTHTTTGVGRLKMAGSDAQALEITGQSGRLEIDNPNGAKLINNLNLVAEEIVFTNGVLDINEFLLTLSSSIKLTPNNVGTSFDNDLMITVDGTSTAQGILYNIPNGTLTDQIIPIGFGSTYTPITFNGPFTSSTVNIKSINGMNNVAEFQGDNTNALNQYWDIEFSDESGFGGDAADAGNTPKITFNYNSVDINNGTQTDYMGIVILPDGKIRKSFHDDKDDSKYEFTVYLNDEALSGSYYMGQDESTPDNVRLYELTNDGDLTDLSNWRYSDDDKDASDPTKVWNAAVTLPTSGTILRVPDGVKLSSSSLGDLGFVNFYKATIEGEFDIHVDDKSIRFYTIEGNGTVVLHVEEANPGVMPNADWNEFFTNGGSLTIDGNDSDHTIAIEGDVVDGKIQLGNLNLIGELGVTQDWKINSGIKLAGTLTVENVKFELGSDSEMTDLLVKNEGILKSVANTTVSNTLIVENGGELNNHNNLMTVGGQTTINGKLKIDNSGVLDVDDITFGTTSDITLISGRELKVSGNYEDLGSTSANFGETSILTFDGTSGNQSFTGDYSGSKALGTVKIDKTPSTEVVNIVNSDSKEISNLILNSEFNNFDNGDGTIIIKQNGSLSGLSYVYGPLSAYLGTNDKLKFLVGSRGYQMPVEVEFTGRDVANDPLGLDVKVWTVEYLVQSKVKDVSKIKDPGGDTGLKEVSAAHQWRITDISDGDASARSNANISLFYGDVGGIDNSLSLRVGLWNDADADSEWDEAGTFDNKYTDYIRSTNVSFSEKYLSISTHDDFSDDLDDVVTELPVELISFTGKYIDNTVELNWSTATEINNDYFEIQRSLDGKTWTSIGIEDGNGNSNVQIDYTFVDNEPASQGISNYRLIQHDYDGQTEILGPIQVAITGENEEATVHLYPNPVEGESVYFLLSGFTNDVDISIYNLVGNLIHTQEWEVSANPRVETYLGQLPEGVYIVRFKSGKTSVTKRLIVK